jgi:multiple sugar transport system permease protein
MAVQTEAAGIVKYKKSKAKNDKVRKTLVTGGAYTWIIIIALSTLLPFIWMVSTSLKPRPEIFYFRFFPLKPTIEHYISVLTSWPYGLWFFNTILVTLVTTFSTLFFCSLSGYALARFKFPGRSLIFSLILATIMVPGTMLIIPWYVGANNLGISNSLTGVIFPSLISAFGVFLMRQAFINIPNELLDAARVDGMSEFWIFIKIALPLVSSALATLGILTAMGTWNDYLWPLIVLQTNSHLTLQLGMTRAAAVDAGRETTVAWDVVMTSTTVAALPMLFLISLLQKYYVKGIALSGLKQ